MMRNKRGDGYITACVTVVILCMLIAAFLTFISVVGAIRMTKRNARIVLDSFVIQNAIEIYDSIKNGTDYTQELDEMAYVDALCDFSKFDKSGDVLYAYGEDGEWIYSITRPVVSFTYEETLKVYASYTVTVPIVFGDVSMEWIRIPVTVESRYNEKF
jgi:hypothetical protein